MKHSKGNVHNIETFGTFDGPGVRYVLFLQGCPFQCKFCHNRDSWSTETNSLMSVEDVLSDFETYKAFYRNGGITVSGGEPLMQTEFVRELFKAAKEKGIHTTLDTSAACFNHKKAALIREILTYTDLVLLDIKHIDEDKHKSLTNASNKQVLAFLDLLETIGKPTIIRHVLIPGINDDENSIDRLEGHLMNYRCVDKVEVLPYHTNGKFKWEAMGLTYPLEGVPAMDKQTAKAIEERLNQSIRFNQNDALDKNYPSKPTRH